MDADRDARGGDEAAGKPAAGTELAAGAALAGRGRLRSIVDEASAAMRDDRARFRLALVYPAVISVVAVVGALWTTATSDRLIRSLEGSFRDPPVPMASSAWSGLTITDLLLVLGGLAIAGLLAAWIMHLRRTVGRHLGPATRCDVLAELADHAEGSLTASDRDRLVADVLRAIEPAVDDTTSPLVTFVDGDDDADRRASSLRATAAFYRTLDARQRETTRRLVPLVGSLIAGMAVLLYATALFRPMVSLLDGLAAPRDVIGSRGEP